MKRIAAETVRTVRTHAVYIAILLLANIAVYYDYWTGYRIFSGKDLLTAFGPLLNFQTDCLQEWSLPLWNPFMNFGYPFVEHYSNTMFFPTHLLMGLLSGSTIEVIQREILFWFFLGGVGTYLCARELGNSEVSSAAIGICYMLCGQVMALPHWHLLVYNAACFPYLILGYNRAVRAGKALSIMSILFLAFSIFGGHITTTVLGVYFFTSYVLVDSIIRNKLLFGIRYLALTFLLSGLIGMPKLAPLAAAMTSGPRMLSPESLYTKDPYNTVNFFQFMSFILPVKYFFSLYIGQLSIIALIFGAIRRRLELNALLVMFILTAWFLMVDSEGNISMLRSAANILPVMKLVRNEWFEWFYPSLFLLLWLVRPVDIFLTERIGRDHVIASTGFVVLLSAVFFAAFNTELYASAYALHILLAVLLSFLPLLRERKNIQLIALVLLVTAEFSGVFSRVGIDEPPVRDDKLIRFTVIDQGAVSRSYMEDNSVRNKFYAVSLQDNLRPSIGKSIGWPVLQSGLGGDPTYNLYPEQFARFIDDMNLKRFSGWWYNAQERHDFIRLKDSGMLTVMDGQPLFSVFSQATGLLSGVASFDAISCSEFDFTVNISEPSRFQINQMYDDRWHVLIDGRESNIRRANEYFMETDVGPGIHRISLRFSDRIFLVSLAISFVTLFSLCGFSIFRGRFRRPQKVFFEG